MAEFVDLEQSSGSGGGGGGGGDADPDGVAARPPPPFPPQPPFVDLENNLPPPHPSLRGGHPPHPHPFSASQMHVISSVSDTIFPPLPPPPLDAHGLPPSPDVQSFYRLSASDWDVPAHTAGLFAKVLRPIHLRATSLVLFLLATRLGTLLLCGGDAVVRQFPFLQPFPDLPQATRERILRKWATSAFFVFQVIFKVLKGTVVWSCFARADEHGYNPTWKAMGYYLPQHKAAPPAAAGEKRGSHQRKPLDGKVIDVQEETALCAKLIELGFWAVEGESHMQRLRRNPAAAAAAKSKKKKKRSAVSETGGGNKDVTVKCDVVVVGSGSGGGVAAGVLARAGLKVVVIEKGGYYARDDFSHIEYSTGMELLEGPSSVNSVNAAVVIKAGTCVGGGSTVNWSAALPTPPHVLREWAEDHHLPLFGEQRYFQAMGAVWRRMQAGVGYKTESLQNQTLREGCRNLGIPVEDVACNAVGEHYCGWCECGCRSGAKQSTAETWLVDAVTAGAVILSGCYAEEVLLKVEAGKRKLKTATGVVAGAGGGGKLYVEARYAVVAACGALQTPLLLKRSGLRNKNIGRNLHLHPCILAWGYRPGAEAPMFEGSIISACCKELGGHKKKDGYGALLQTPSALPGAFSFIAPWESGEQFKRMMQRYSRTCVVFTLTRDKTKGRVEEGEGGKIIVRYEMCQEDKETAMEALELGIRILAAAPGVAEVGTMSVHAEACRVAAEEGGGGGGGGAAAARLEEYLRKVKGRGIRGLDFPIQSGHQMGTCRMGSSPATSVVDPSCESWEAEGLFLADTSVFPTALGVNPMVTVQSIAFCTAHNILHWLRSTRKIPNSSPPPLMLPNSSSS